MPKERLFSIVYEDKDILVADKPPGLLAVPIPGSKKENLADLVSSYTNPSGGRIQAVHRIDRFTSGLMVFAKHDKAFHHLKRQFSRNQPERIYLAMVRGALKTDFGELRHHLQRIKSGFRNVVVSETDPEGTPAFLEYEIVERFSRATLVAVRLGTGLKNQIRVQFAAAGHPVIGDRHYSASEQNVQELDRQALHAYRLEFKHPAKNKNVAVEAKIPPDLQQLIDSYRRDRKA